MPRGFRNSTWKVRPADSPDEVAAALALRERVFSGEQGVRLEADRDGRDPEATHLVAVTGGAVIGTCRLVFDGPVARLGRMAVEPEFRGSGVGAALLEGAEGYARAAGARRIDLHAQTAAVSLYARGGFVQHGERFIEEGIPHVTMEKVLA
jgi:predicted GNAT family N-acyltransferase